MFLRAPTELTQHGRRALIVYVLQRHLNAFDSAALKTLSESYYVTNKQNKSEELGRHEQRDFWIQEKNTTIR